MARSLSGLDLRRPKPPTSVEWRLRRRFVSTRCRDLLLAVTSRYDLRLGAGKRSICPAWSSVDAFVVLRVCVGVRGVEFLIEW